MQIEEKVKGELAMNKKIKFILKIMTWELMYWKVRGVYHVSGYTSWSSVLTTPFKVQNVACCQGIWTKPKSIFWWSIPFCFEDDDFFLLHAMIEDNLVLE